MLVAMHTESRLDSSTIKVSALTGIFTLKIDKEMHSKNLTDSKKQVFLESKADEDLSYLS